MKVTDVANGTKQYAFNIVDELAQNDFVIGAARPFIKMVIENNFHKVSNFLKIAADEKGEIDIEKLIDDSIKSTLNSKQAIYPLGSFGTIEFGNNAMKLNILNKFVKFDANDFIKLKNYLVENYK